jgi:hypothetical protein
MRRWKNIAREKINYLVCNSGDIGAVVYSAI